MHPIIFWNKNRAPHLFAFRYATGGIAFWPAVLKWPISSRLSFSSFSSYPINLPSTTSHVPAQLTSLLSLILSARFLELTAPEVRAFCISLCMSWLWETAPFLWHFVLTVDNILPASCLKSIRNTSLKFCSFLWSIMNNCWQEQELSTYLSAK